jgi:cobalt-precorrin 5A hydrolase
MCGFYDDSQKIKKGDYAKYQDKPIIIISATHIKENKTMDIVIEYLDTKEQETINIPYKTTGFGFVKTNIMGSEVVDGFECKPKQLDPNKPIMHYKTLIYVCEDQRCQKASKPTRVKELRQIVKDLGLDKGKDRIKISRSLCQGACRFRQVMQINENTNSNGCATNNSVWLKHTHKLIDTDLKELFLLLKNDQPLDKFQKIEMQQCYQ